jgi:hypothetical protein
MSNAHIEKRLELLEKAEIEYKTQKEMLADALANDGELGDLEEKMKDAKRRYLAQKEAILNEPENRKLVEQMRELAGEIKDTKKLLANELVAYFLEHKSFDYVDGRGNRRHISVTAKFTASKEQD